VLRDAHVGGHELALKLILDYARLLDLLGKQEIQFEQENTSLPALSDDLLGVPGLEGVLQHFQSLDAERWLVFFIQFMDVALWLLCSRFTQRKGECKCSFRVSEKRRLLLLLLLLLRLAFLAGRRASAGSRRWKIREEN